MTATVARINGELASHSFSHVSSISKQVRDINFVLQNILRSLGCNCSVWYIASFSENSQRKRYHSCACTQRQCRYSVNRLGKLKLLIAGTYHCAGLIASLLNFSSTLKITVISHIFSEPQYGKVSMNLVCHHSNLLLQGRADREISLCKGKLNSYIDSGNSACTPSEIIDGFTNNILLKVCVSFVE